ncbi:MAG TPA: universal stress protein [bacterium]|nr:universal stress protein [bacterium]
MKLYDTILVATDLTEASEQALEYAFETARSDESKLIVLHVLQGSPADRYLPENFEEYSRTLEAYWLDPYTLSLFSRRQELSREREEKRTYLENQIPYDLKKQTEVLISIGDPLSEIIATASQVKASVLIVGSHQRRGFSLAIQGSAAEKLVRKSPCPVLVVGHRAGKETMAKAA